MYSRRRVVQVDLISYTFKIAKLDLTDELVVDGRKFLEPKVILILLAIFGLQFR